MPSRAALRSWSSWGELPNDIVAHIVAMAPVRTVARLARAQRRCAAAAGAALRLAVTIDDGGGDLRVLLGAVRPRQLRLGAPATVWRAVEAWHARVAGRHAHGDSVIWAQHGGGDAPFVLLARWKTRRQPSSEGHAARSTHKVCIEAIGEFGWYVRLAGTGRDHLEEASIVDANISHVSVAALIAERPPTPYAALLANVLANVSAPTVPLASVSRLFVSRRDDGTLSQLVAHIVDPTRDAAEAAPPVLGRSAWCRGGGASLRVHWGRPSFRLSMSCTNAHALRRVCDVTDDASWRFVVTVPQSSRSDSDVALPTRYVDALVRNLRGAVVRDLDRVTLSLYGERLRRCTPSTSRAAHAPVQPEDGRVSHRLGRRIAGRAHRMLRV